MVVRNDFPFSQTMLDFYRDHAENVLLPFWQRAVDEKNGGIYTCFDNSGVNLISRDKYTWSQGRFIWLWSKIAQLIQKRLLSGEPAVYLTQAAKAVDFLWDHALLKNGNCAYLLSETGEPKEVIPGQGYDLSFYADCFVVLGFSEYAKAARDPEVLVKALKLYDTIVRRVKSGSLRSEPYPIPQGLRAHSVPMILLNVVEELHSSLALFEHPRREEFGEAAISYAKEIMTDFYNEDGRITEMLAPAGSRLNETILCRHVNPGHTIEDMWFVLHAVHKIGGTDWTPRAAQVVKRAFDLGWDEEFGGLLRFVDREGGEPQGTMNNDPYESLIRDTWDTKLWWPHSEALYTTLLMYHLTGDQEFLALYQKSHDYVFATFPNPERKVGEWIQIRSRNGRPIDKVVALPVKDPYHILRNVLLTLELIDQNLNEVQK